MRKTLSTILGFSLLATLLAACGNGGGLSTSSILGGGNSSAPPAPKPVTASERALFVGATVARAQRCGFVFDPEQVRANFIAAESQAGTPPEQVQKVTREFDFTRKSVLDSAVKDETYCTEGRTRDVKAALGRQLAGDFNTPQRRPEVDVSWHEHQTKRDTLKGEEIFDRSARPNRGMDQ
jgi:hypothetical protein